MIIALDLKRAVHQKIEHDLDKKGLIINYVGLSFDSKYCIIDIPPSEAPDLETIWIESEKEGYSHVLSDIQYALQYPPSIAMAFCRAEDASSEDLSLSQFVQAFAEDVVQQLENVEKDGFHLRKVIQSDDFELRVNKYYWVKIIDDKQCLWVSLDYQVYETRRTHFLGL